MLNQIFLLVISKGLSTYFSGWTFWPVIFFIVGIAFMIGEMLTPGIGIFGACGLVSLAACVIIQANTFTDALLTILLIILSLGIAAFIVFRSFNKGLISKTNMVLDDETYAKAKDEEKMIGKTGVAINDLRPSGFVDIDGDRVDVVTSGDFIKRGSTVKIIATEGSKLVVKSADK